MLSSSLLSHFAHTVCWLQFKDRSTANNVEVILPLPPDAITPIVKTSTGAAV
jgi:hypothetical protein